MALFTETGTTLELLPVCKFGDEKELEDLLRRNPDLLNDSVGSAQDGKSKFWWAGSQVNLGDAGRLDLLFVDGDGIPIAVEVKLGVNEEARRKVVAQAIDYVSALSNLTVDELDALVDEGLDDALRCLAGQDDAEFDRLWSTVGKNLRAGNIRMIVALDGAPPSLERMLRFLARCSNLDVRLVTVQQHRSDAGRIVASQSRMDPRTERGSDDRKPLTGALSAAVKTYNQTALDDLKAEGTASDRRDISIETGVPGRRCFYRFSQKANAIRVTLYFNSESLVDGLKPYVGRALGDGAGSLEWLENPAKSSWRLFANLPNTAPAESIAQAMRDLIAMTRSVVCNSLQTPAAMQAAT